MSAQDKQEDYYKGFRSGVVLVWVFTNLILAAAILSSGLDDLDPNNPKQNEAARSVIYMAVVLYSVAALSFFRFVGAMWFLVVRMVCFCPCEFGGVANLSSSAVFNRRDLVPYVMVIWGDV